MGEYYNFSFADIYEKIPFLAIIVQRIKGFLQVIGIFC